MLKLSIDSSSLYIAMCTTHTYTIHFRLLSIYSIQTKPYCQMESSKQFTRTLQSLMIESRGECISPARARARARRRTSHAKRIAALSPASPQGDSGLSPPRRACRPPPPPLAPVSSRLRLPSRWQGGGGLLKIYFIVRFFFQ